MTGLCLAFNPCRDCTHKEMCSICELALFKSGALTPQNLPQLKHSLSIGDTVYLIRKGKVAEETVQRIGITKHNVSYGMNRRGCGYEVFFDCEIGKTVFLTPEEAERALKGADDEQR